MCHEAGPAGPSAPSQVKIAPADGFTRLQGPPSLRTCSLTLVGRGLGSACRPPVRRCPHSLGTAPWQPAGKCAPEKHPGNPRTLHLRLQESSPEGHALKGTIRKCVVVPGTVDMPKIPANPRAKAGGLQLRLEIKGLKMSSAVTHACPACVRPCAPSLHSGPAKICDVNRNGALPWWKPGDGSACGCDPARWEEVPPVVCIMNRMTLFLCCRPSLRAVVWLEKMSARSR